MSSPCCNIALLWLLLQFLVTNHCAYAFGSLLLSLGSRRSTHVATKPGSSSQCDSWFTRVPGPPLNGHGFHGSTAARHGGICFTRNNTLKPPLLRLALQRDPEEEKEDFRTDAMPRQKEEDGPTIVLEQPGLLIADTVAIAIASQLVGLLDVLNDPIFWSMGGWLQPVPVIPSTLGILVERFATLTVTWIGVALLLSSSVPSSSSSTEKLSPNFSQETDTGLSLFGNQIMSMDEPSLKQLWKVWVVFSLTRIGLGVALYSWLQTGPGWTADTIVTTELLSDLIRQCYIVGLTIPTARFVYHRLFF
jgi:hypothetical protein